MLDVSYFQRAAVGSFDALESLIAHAGPAVRLLIAAYYYKPSAIPLIEREVWKAIRKQLSARHDNINFETWLVRTLDIPIRAHLKAADQQAISAADTLTHQSIQDCLSSLDQHSENGVLSVPQRVGKLPAPIRNLLEQRYRLQRGINELSKGLSGGASALAVTLLGARAECDWREIARAPEPNETMVSALVEDWLTEKIDPESRALLAENLARDFERTAQVMRQLRVHVALSAYYKSFTNDEARTLARLASESEADRVVIGAAPSSTTSSRAMVKNLTPTGRSSHASARALDEDTARPSPLPWIISGVLVVGGIIGLVALSLNNRPTPMAPAPSTEDPTPPKIANNNSVVTPPTSVNKPPVTTAVEPPPVEKKNLQAMLFDPTKNAPPLHARQRIQLRALLSKNDGVERVEFKQDDEVIGTATSMPWVCDWEPRAGGEFSLSLQVYQGGKVIATSEARTVTVRPAFGSGTITREWWTGIGGGTLAEAAPLNDWPNKPQGRDTIDKFETPRDWNDNFVQRVRGYIVPPLTGTYTFFLAADDEAELWLSTDASPLHVKRIAHAPLGKDGGIPFHDWRRYPSQISAKIPLTAEQRYYVEMRHKEGGGQDHAEVAWELPTSEFQGPIIGVHLAPINGDEPPAPIPRQERTSPPTTQPPATLTPTVADVMIWDGEKATAGAAYRGSGNEGMQIVADAGRVGAGLRVAVAGANFANFGWNWHSWNPPGVGTDLTPYAALSFWLRVTGDSRPESLEAQLTCTTGSSQKRTPNVQLMSKVPALTNGEWHQVIIPLSEFVPAGYDFDLTKVWEISFYLKANKDLNMVMDVDDICAHKTLPSATHPPVIQAAAVPETWTVVSAINLGGEAVEINGVKWSAHRQAETEGATPVNSLQPGPFLDELTWVKAVNGNGEIRRNRSHDNKPLSLDGRGYARGLGVHAPCEIIYALNGNYIGLTAEVGIDDEAPEGSVIFQVFADNKKVWDSGEVFATSPAKKLEAPLLGCKELRLVVDTSGGPEWDHADWADARLVRKGGNDGALVVQNGRRTTKRITPKAEVDKDVRTMLSTVLVGSKDGLSFSCKAPDGPARVSLWLGENGVSNSRSSDFVIEGQLLERVGDMATNEWQKIGPVAVNVSGGYVDVQATPIKGIPQVMGILIEKLEAPKVSSTAAGGGNDPLTTIADANGYVTIYQADVAKMAAEVPYDVNNSQEFKGDFNRIAYLLELQAANGPLQWVWTSMDPFTKELKAIGVPTLKSGALFRGEVTNLFVASNVEGVVPGALGIGRIEFWSCNYIGKNESGIDGATDAFDIGDVPTNIGTVGHGSMQIHNLRDRQTVWALNNWKAGAKADIGIGNAPAPNTDWTFMANGEKYALKRLRVFVKPTP